MRQEIIEEGINQELHVKHLGGGSMGSRRNSSIELLRILSMSMILLSHFVVHNEFDYTTMPLGIPRFLLQLFFESGGKSV